MLDRNNQNQVSEEVIHSVEKMVNLEIADIDHLIELASQNKRKRIRYCSHKNPSEKVHEMFIVHPNGAYVRPHKHINKIESMLVLRGEVDYVVFNDDGSIFKVIPMGDLKSGKVFYNSLREDVFHTLLIRTEWLVFMEITKGPFNKQDTVFSPWSPAENDLSGQKAFMKQVELTSVKLKNG